jgi:DNA transformation protein
VSADQLTSHALDLFAGLGPGVVAKRMFGGLGFWSRGRFFAIGDPDEGRLYLKVDDVTRARFEAAGGQPFTYRSRDGQVMVMSYFTPPDDALDDPESMLPWARLGLEAAGRAAAARAPKRKPKAGGGATPRREAAPTRKGAPRPATKPATRRATRRR